MTEGFGVEIFLSDESFVMRVVMPVVPRVGETLWPTDVAKGIKRPKAYEVQSVCHHCSPSGNYSCVVYVEEI